MHEQHDATPDNRRDQPATDPRREADTPPPQDADRPSPQRPFRVVSFDGGGVHALAYLPVLRHLEQHLGCTLAESGQFDMFVGTSTGAIVATAFHLGAKADEIMGLYEKHAGEIFKPERWFNRPFFKYRSIHLRRILADFYRTRFGSNDDSNTADPTWRDLASRVPAEDCELVVTLWDVRQETTVFLSTNLDRPGQAQILWDAPLADIVTACCSAPTYFPPRAFDKGREVYCDGGVTGLNNPAIFGVSLVTNQLHEASRKLDVLSFGSGESTADRKLSQIRGRNFIGGGLATIDSLMNSSSRLMDRFHESFGAGLRIRLYLRTNHLRDPSSALDDIAAVPELVRYFERGLLRYRLTKRSDDGAVEGEPRSGPSDPRDFNDWNTLWSQVFRLQHDPSPRRTGTPVVHSRGPCKPLLARESVESYELLPTWWNRIDLLSNLYMLVFGLVLLIGVPAWFLRGVRATSDLSATARLFQNRELENAQRLVSSEVPPFRDVPASIGLLAMPHGDHWHPYYRTIDNARMRALVLQQVHEFESVRDPDLESQLGELVTEVEKWDPSCPPSQSLQQSARRAALLFRSVWNRRSARFEEKMSTALRGAMNTERRDAYNKAIAVVEDLIRIDGKLDESHRKTVTEFYKLYFGGLLLVESREVKNFMIDLGKPLGAKGLLATWIERGEKPDGFNELAEKFLAVLRKSNDQLDWWEGDVHPFATMQFG